MIIDFEKRREKKADEDFLHIYTQAISIRALFDITYEIQTVVNFMDGIDSVGQVFSPQDPENKDPDSRAELFMLAYMCEKQGRNLKRIAAAIKRATGLPTEREATASQTIVEENAELYPEQHETILEKQIFDLANYASNLTNIE